MHRSAALALAFVAAGLACERAERTPIDRSAAALVTLRLHGSEQLPQVQISVPRFGASWSALKPAAYWLRGGSVREGLATSIFVGTKDRCRRASCADPRVVDTPAQRTQTCRSEREATVEVEHRRSGWPICCTASWTLHGELTDERRQIARAIENACASLR